MAQTGSTNKTQHRPPRQAPRSPAAEQASIAAKRQRRILDKYIRRLGAELDPASSTPSIHRIRSTLDRITEIVGNGASDIADRDYQRSIQDLTAIYADGYARREDRSFMSSAAGYARVVKALSSRCRSCDFGEAIGQLLDLMTRLFERRQHSWKSIYRLLRAIPRTVSGRERLELVCATHVPEWFDASVPNLFSRQRELRRGIDELSSDIETLKADIRSTEAELKKDIRASRAIIEGEIAVLSVKRKQRQLADLERKMRRVCNERDQEASLVADLETDINALRDRLRAAGRHYWLRLV
jgi:outer membrane murein-binding lipoprotein Lpp